MLCYPAFAQPLEIDDKKNYRLPPEVKDFKLWYGEVGTGEIIYLGTKPIAGFETELHIHFFKNKIFKTLLILGPAGIYEGNCIKIYKEVIAVVNEKYGHYKYQKIIKDPIADDLVASSICIPIQLNLYDIVTQWEFGDYTITSRIIGDEDGWYIEIEYVKKSPANKNSLKKIL